MISCHLGKQFKSSFLWLMRSKEFANFTYDLTSSNREYLAWFVAEICKISKEDAWSYFHELETNSVLAEHIETELAKHRRGNEIDGQAFFGRRLGWYAIVRATKPAVVVETGTEKGLGSLVIAAALIENGHGRLVTIDIERSSGILIGGKYSQVVEHVISDSLIALSKIEVIDLFIHDSNHSAIHERHELELVCNRLSTYGIVLSDNSHVSNELAQWSSRNNRRFFYFAEQPTNHWYPGAGIGASLANSYT